MKVVLAFDSFKETMSSIEVANIVKEELLIKNPDLEVECISISDGGEGSLDSIAYSRECEVKEYIVTGPHFEKIKTKVINIDGDYYIESADIVGFKYKKIDDHPKDITTLGIGELIKIILDDKPKSINICLGGTISNDGGCGLLYALGIRFYDEENKEFIPLGKTLSKINKIDISCIDKRIFETKIFALSDVTNPLYGLNGASYVFARQKGATDLEIEMLDLGLKNLNRATIDVIKKDVSFEKGCGAAGGIGFACLAFLNAKIISGIEAILEACDFDNKIRNADYIFTGEGRLDSQSFQGKAIMGIISRAEEYNISVIGIFGTTSDEKLSIPNVVKKIYKTNYLNLPFEEVKKTCYDDLRRIVKFINL